MKPEPYSNGLGIPSPSKESLEIYIDLITKTVNGIRKRFGAPDHITDQVADQIIYLSLSFYAPEEWKRKFIHFRAIATNSYTNPRTYWKTIAAALSTPEVEEAHKKLFPSLKKPFSLKIAMGLCVAWMLDPRWQKLSPCAKLLFYFLVFRTYRKDTFRKIKQALANGETYFPWCLTGINSLSKQLTYQLGPSTRIKHYEACWIKRSLRQLWDLGFIHRIFRGYEDQGAGKYHVFLNPKMSARFHKAAIDDKRGLTPYKRRSRMS